MAHAVSIALRDYERRELQEEFLRNVQPYNEMMCTFLCLQPHPGFFVDRATGEFHQLPWPEKTQQIIDKINEQIAGVYAKYKE